MVEQYNYLVQQLSYLGDLDLEGHLNGLGQRGWKLASVEDHRWVFVRPQDGAMAQYRPQEPMMPQYRPQEAAMPQYRPQEAAIPQYFAEETAAPQYRPQEAAMPQATPQPMNQARSYARADYRPRAGLTPREQDIARLVAEGMNNRDISVNLHLKEQSVKNMVSAAMRKMEAENRTQLALKYWEMFGEKPQ